MRSPTLVGVEVEVPPREAFQLMAGAPPLPMVQHQRYLPWLVKYSLSPSSMTVERTLPASDAPPMVVSVRSSTPPAVAAVLSNRGPA